MVPATARNNAEWHAARNRSHGPVCEFGPEA